MQHLSFHLEIGPNKAIPKKEAEKTSDNPGDPIPRTLYVSECMLSSSIEEYFPK